MESFLYRDDSTFFKETIIQSVPKIMLHRYIEMHPHFLRKQLFILCQNLVASLYRNDSTFLKNTMGGFFIAKCVFPVNVTYTE